MEMVLVTGGAGYVGSHAAAALLAAGNRVVVVDDLRGGHRAAVPDGAELVEASLEDRAAVESVFAARRVDAVMHFAAHSLVGESMARPFLYLGDDVACAANLLRAAGASGVGKFVLSSTASLFGATTGPIDEDCGIAPASPYGESKYTIERMLDWAERIFGMRTAALRYFNAAGADSGGKRGEDHRPETHLIPLVLQAALGQRPEVEVFGDDYPTADGTCVRDYVHVADLADAHLAVLDALNRASCRYNLGSGRGHSVREVIAAARAVTGARIAVRIGPRRPGDPAVLVASSERIRNDLGWRPRTPELEGIIESAWRWHQSHPHGYAGR